MRAVAVGEVDQRRAHRRRTARQRDHRDESLQPRPAAGDQRQRPRRAVGISTGSGVEHRRDGTSSRPLVPGQRVEFVGLVGVAGGDRRRAVLVDARRLLVGQLRDPGVLGVVADLLAAVVSRYDR